MATVNLSFSDVRRNWPVLGLWHTTCRCQSTLTDRVSRPLDMWADRRANCIRMQ